MKTALFALLLASSAVHAQTLIDDAPAMHFHSQHLFSEVGVVQVECPWPEDVLEQMTSVLVCGVYDLSPDLFRLSVKVSTETSPYLEAEAFSAWQSEADKITQLFTVEGDQNADSYAVSLYDDGLVVMLIPVD